MGPQLSKSMARVRASNTPLDPMKNILSWLISTGKGHATRQALKLATLAGASSVSWLTAHDIPISDPAVITAAITTLALGLVELALSKLASYVGVPLK